MSLLVTALMVFVTFSQEPAAAQPGDPKPRAAAIIAVLAAKDFTKVEDQFDDKMKAALPTERLAMAWGTILRRERSRAAAPACGCGVRVARCGSRGARGARNDRVASASGGMWCAGRRMQSAF